MKNKNINENQQVTPLTTQEAKAKAKVYTSATGGPIGSMQYVTQNPENQRVNKDNEIMKYSQFGTEFAMDSEPLSSQGKAYKLETYKNHTRKLFNLFLKDFIDNNDLKNITIENAKNVSIDVNTFKKAIGKENISDRKANELLANAGKQLLMARIVKNIGPKDNIAISFVSRSNASKHNTLILTPSADLINMASTLKLTQSALTSLSIGNRDYFIENIAKIIEDCINAQPFKDPLPIKISTLIPYLDIDKSAISRNWRRDIQVKLERSMNALAGIGEYNTDFLEYWHYAIKENGEFKRLDNIAFTDPDTNDIKAINEYNKEVRKMFKNYDQYEKGYIIIRSVIHDNEKFKQIRDQKKRTADLRKAKKINRENKIINQSKERI